MPPVTIIQPSEIKPLNRGWISPGGTIFSGRGEHSSIIADIEHTFNDEVSPGWIRWLTNMRGEVYFDWSWAGGDDAENICRTIARKMHHPFEIVWVDTPRSAWKGSFEDFIKHGTKARSLHNDFRTRLEARLREIE